MGRLIDEDVLIDAIPDLNAFEEEDFCTSAMLQLIEDTPTAEAIPKDQYEARLKADMVAILTDIQLEIEENSYPENVYGDEYGINEIIPTDGIYQIIQQKIDALKADKERNEKKHKSYSFS